MEALPASWRVFETNRTPPDDDMPVPSEPRRTSITLACKDDIPIVRSLWREYWASLGLGSDFQNFGEELRTLPGLYALPKGRLLLARVGGEVAGTAALRHLTDLSCEAKRLYVRPHFRGAGVGRPLLGTLIHEAREAAYKEMYGDTLESMTSALRMYRQSGFREVGPYSSDPTPGAVFLKLSLPAQ